MNKILAIGLIAAVTSSAYSECCCRSFYIGANFGVNFSETNVKTQGVSYEDGDTYGASDSGWKVVEGNNIDPANKTVGKMPANFGGDFLDDFIIRKNSKKLPLVEIAFGYDFKTANNFIFGAELTVGISFGKTKFKSQEVDLRPVATPNTSMGVELTKIGSLKQQWHIALMPHVGYQFKQGITAYLTGGVKFARWKLRIPNLMGARLTGQIGEAIGDADQASMKKKASIRVVPVIGAGIRFEFTPKIFGKLEYNYEFKTKAKKSSSMTPEYKKVTSLGHVFKLGVGYRF